LSERIELTENDFLHHDYGIRIECNDNTKKILSQQILEDHKIVDLLILYYQQAEHDDITVASILSEIYNDATGKDIQEIHSMENVK